MIGDKFHEPLQNTQTIVEHICQTKCPDIEHTADDILLDFIAAVEHASNCITSITFPVYDGVFLGCMNFNFTL